jgi:hypothetical protein
MQTALLSGHTLASARAPKRRHRYSRKGWKASPQDCYCRNYTAREQVRTIALGGGGCVKRRERHAGLTDFRQFSRARNADVRGKASLRGTARVLWAIVFFILMQYRAGAVGPTQAGPDANTQDPSASATTSLLGRTLRSWVEAAVSHELQVIDDDGSQPLRFRVHKIDAKSDTVRVEIETKLGGVARLVERNGQPLTAAEDAAEQERLREVQSHSEEFARHHRRDAGTRQDSNTLVKLMPEAMLYSYTAGQPQWQGFAGQQVVLDFSPNPKFHPPSMTAEMLSALAGRMWIDARSGRVVRIEARVLRPVSFGWGIVGKIYPGGTLALEQANPIGERWIYSRLDMHLNLRVIVKNIAMNDRMAASDFEPLPGPVSLQDAVQMLLSMHVPTR